MYCIPKMKPNERLTVPVSSELLADFDALVMRFPLIKRAALARRALELGLPFLVQELTTQKPPPPPRTKGKPAAAMTKEEADELREEMVRSGQARSDKA